MKKLNIFTKIKEKVSTSKFKHGTSASAVTALVLVVIFAVNIVATALGDRFPSLDLDLTSLGLNSLSEESEEIAADVSMDTYIYLIGDETDIKNDAYFTSYGIQYSQVANIAEKLAEASSYIHVEYIDPDSNPSFIAEYASDDIGISDVIVQTGLRYRVLTVNDLFQYSTDDYGYTYLYTSVDSAIANAIYITNLDNVPLVAFATGHSELISDTSSIETLLLASAFDVVTFNILTEEIPEGTDILFLPSPTTDYSTDEIDKIEEFLAYTYEDRGLVVTSTVTSDETPNFDDFLAEWGISVSNGILYETDTSYMISTNNKAIFLADVNTEEFTESDYSLIVNVSCSPIELLFSSNNGITTYPVLYTSGSTYEVVDGTEDSSDTDTHITVALAQRYNYDNSLYTETNVLVIGDTYSLHSDFILSSTFDNGEFYVQMLNYLAGTDDNNIGLSVESVQTTTYDISATYNIIYNVTFLGFTIIVPIAIFAVGLVIFFRRRYL